MKTDSSAVTVRPVTRQDFEAWKPLWERLQRLLRPPRRERMYWHTRETNAVATGAPSG